MCEYFALCGNDPVGTIAHPVLPPVPTCQTCADKVTRLGGGPLVPFTTEDDGDDPNEPEGPTDRTHLSNPWA